MGRVASKNNRGKKGRTVTKRRRSKDKLKGFSTKLGQTMWKRRQSIAQNYENAGITARPNADALGVAPTGAARDAGSMDLDVVHPDFPSVTMLFKNPLRRKQKLAFVKTAEVDYLNRLVAKHGEGNVKAMEKDYELNTQQHSAQALRSKLGKLKAAVAGKGGKGATPKDEEGMTA
jgi:hypothetical protein